MVSPAARKPPARKPPVKKVPAKKAAPVKRAQANKTTAPSAGDLPSPPRPLATEGRKLWERVWTMRNRWISRSLDLDLVLVLCESVDERSALRARVIREADWRDRVALRALDAQIDKAFGDLGLNPTERVKLKTGPQEKGRLAEMRSARGKQAR